MSAALGLNCGAIYSANDLPADPLSANSELADDVEDTPQLPDDSELLDREYQGRSLRQWRVVLKNLDHTDPSAIAEIPGLIEIMQDDELPWFTRRQVALTLGRIGEPASEAIPLLVEQLDSADEDTVNWAAKAIALFGPVGASAAPTLADIVQDETRSHPTRMMSMEALARIGASEPEVLPALITQLQSSGDTADELELRIAACDALALLRANAAPALPHLIRLLTDDSSRLRMSAATTIATMGAAARSAIDPLVDVVLFDAAPEVRDAAALALGSIGTSAVPALLVLAADQEAEVRRQSAVALARVPSSADVVAALERMTMNDDSEVVRITAVESLRTLEVDANSTIPPALALIECEDRQIRIRAYRLLLVYRDQAELILPRMTELLQDDRRYVRDTARRFLTDWERGEETSSTP